MRGASDEHSVFGPRSVGKFFTISNVTNAPSLRLASLVSHGIKAVDEKTYESMLNSVSTCTSMIKTCNEKDIGCSLAYTFCNAKLTSPYYASGLNPYDIRLPCGDNPLCYDFSMVETWLRSEATLDALHVTSESRKWQSCNNAVNAEFKNDWMKRFDPFVADLLEAGIRVMIYAGDVDFICNSLGNKAWTLEFNWSGKEDFNAASDKEWNNGHGTIRSAKGLTFLEVNDAGHMVPHDQPEVALDMINQFLAGQI